MSTTNKGILFPARTNSDFDSVDALFIPIEKCKRIVEEQAKFAPIIAEHSLFCIQTLDSSPTFINTDRMEDENEFNTNGAHLVDLEDSELDNMPENKLRSYTTKFFSHEGVTIQCYGEHTNDEFWAEIDLNLLKQLIAE